jgi:hypothetical protein
MQEEEEDETPDQDHDERNDDWYDPPQRNLEKW